MEFRDLATLLARSRSTLATGPVAVTLAEDEVELGATIAHNHALGFASQVVLHPGWVDLPGDLPGRVLSAPWDPRHESALCDAVNRVIEAVPPGTWISCGYNAEFLFYPFCETRRVGEMLAFHAGERRPAVPACVVDLYADDLARHPDGIDRAAPLFDRIGYFALGGNGAGETEPPVDLYGGLKWRFEQHVPTDRRRIDRIALFQTRKGLRLGPDHRFNLPGYNALSCAWHRNLTAAICSFRTAKALRTNPASRFEIDGFRWFGSEPFGWSSRQLMDHGLMEPGQWF